MIAYTHSGKIAMLVLL